MQARCCFGAGDDGVLVIRGEDDGEVRAQFGRERHQDRGLAGARRPGQQHLAHTALAVAGEEFQMAEEMPRVLQQHRIGGVRLKPLRLRRDFPFRESDIAVPLECTPQSAFGQFGAGPLAPALQQQIEVANGLFRSGQIFAGDFVVNLAADRVQHRAVAEVDAERAGAVGEHQLAASAGAHHHRPGARRRDGRGYRRDRQARGRAPLPPLDQQRQQPRHQMLVLHDHRECVAVVLAVQREHLLDHGRFGRCHVLSSFRRRLSFVVVAALTVG
jgi:hypothetical protein